MKMSKHVIGIASCILLSACGGESNSSSTSEIVSVPESIVTTHITSQALNSLKTSFEMKGGYVLTDSGGTEYLHTQNIIFAENEYYYDDCYEGKLLYKDHLIRENNSIYLLSVDKNNALIKKDVSTIVPTFTWNQVVNPFLELVESDFVQGSEVGVFTISNEKADSLADALSGYTELTESVNLTVENDLVKRIEFVSLSSDGISRYSFQISNHGVAVGPTIPYATNSHHAALKTALMGLNGNYTIEHFDQSVGFDDISYTYYMTEDAVYKDASELGEESEQSGFFSYKDEVYKFEVETGNVILGDIAAFDLFAELPDFDFAPELFEYVGPNLYQAHDSIVASMIGNLIGEDYDAKMAGAYAHKMTIELKDEKLYQIKLSYNIYGVLISDITMTFSDIGATTLPIDLSGLKLEIDNNQPIEGDFSHMYGTYSGNFNSSTLIIKISEESITFNNNQASFIEIDENDDLVVNYEGTTYYLTYESSYDPVAIMITDGAKWGLLSQQTGTTDPAIELPAAIAGEWDIDTGSEKITISIIGNTILFNGESTELLSFDEYFGDIEFIYEGTTYHIIYIEDSQGSSEEFALCTEDYSLIGDGVRQGSSSINVPDYMEGNWIFDFDEDDDIQLEITGNVVIFNGITATVTDLNFYGLYIDVNGISYCLYYIEYDDIMQLYDGVTDYFLGLGSRFNPPILIKSELIGTFEGIMTGIGEFQDYNVEIVISESSITINGVAVTEIIFDEEWGSYEFTYDDDTFTLETYDDGIATTIYLFI